MLNPEELVKILIELLTASSNTLKAQSVRVFSHLWVSACMKSLSHGVFIKKSCGAEFGIAWPCRTECTPCCVPELCIFTWGALTWVEAPCLLYCENFLCW